MSARLPVVVPDPAQAERAVELWSAQLRLLGWRREPVAVRACPRTGSALVHEAQGRLVRGRRLAWTGPGDARTWELAGPVSAVRVGSATAWATLDGVPVIGPARDAPEAVSIGVEVEDAHAHAELAAVLRRSLAALGPAACWLDLQATLVMRMDDPGAAASVYLRDWSFEKPSAADWRQVGEILAGDEARMTISYTPGWPDDGDGERGELLVGGRRVRRRAGAVHPSPLVRYRGHTAPSADGELEFREIERLRASGVCSVELHGYTHVHPELERWAASPTRDLKVGWYREFAPENTLTLAGREPDEHPVSLGLDLFRRHFGETPAALVFPGNAHSPHVLRRAYEADLEAVAADRLAIRAPSGFQWLGPVAATDFSEPSERLLSGEAPPMGCLHDRDIARGGPAWLERGLRAWRSAGARRIIDLRELISALGLAIEVAPASRGARVEVRREHGPPLAQPFPLLLRAAGLGGGVELATPSRSHEAVAAPLGHDLWRVELPAGV